MADFAVEKARYRLLQQNRARARAARAPEGTIGGLKRRAQALTFPLMVASGLQAARPPRGREEDLLEHLTAQQAAREDLALRQAQARRIQAQDVAATGAGAVTTASRTTGRGPKKKQPLQAAAAKKQDEAIRRRLIRPAQASLFGTSVASSAAVITLIAGGGTWLAWKSLELYKTLTGGDVGVLDPLAVRWNAREGLQFIVAFFTLFILTCVIVYIVVTIGYYLLNPMEAAQLFPLFSDLLSIIL